MIFYSRDKNVYEAGKERIRFILDEFPDHKIAVSISGGKDSTAVLHLVKEVMDERGIKKIPVFFLDQEGEAPQVVEYVRYIMHLPWVEPYWMQTYFREWNSSKGEWFNVWGPGEEWIREKEPNNPLSDADIKVKENFPKVLGAAFEFCFGDKYVVLGGVRMQESISRRGGLLNAECYKDITWGKANTKTSLSLYPIYDWSTYDVWYYIMKNRFKYCSLYNYYMTKRPLVKCRVSSFIHENSISSLRDIKEIAPEFYKQMLRRVENINTTVQCYSGLCSYVDVLPPYFSSWREYVSYLADNLCEEAKNAEKLKKGYIKFADRCLSKHPWNSEQKKRIEEICGRSAAKCVVSEDYGLSKLNNVIYEVLELWK